MQTAGCCPISDCDSLHRMRKERDAALRRAEAAEALPAEWAEAHESQSSGSPLKRRASGASLLDCYFRARQLLAARRPEGSGEGEEKT